MKILIKNKERKENKTNNKSESWNSDNHYYRHRL